MQTQECEVVLKCLRRLSWRQLFAILTFAATATIWFIHLEQRVDATSAKVDKMESVVSDIAVIKNRVVDIEHHTEELRVDVKDIRKALRP